MWGGSCSARTCRQGGVGCGSGRCHVRQCGVMRVGEVWCGVGAGRGLFLQMQRTGLLWHAVHPVGGCGHLGMLAEHQVRGDWRDWRAAWGYKEVRAHAAGR